MLGRARASGTQALSVAFRDAVAAARARDGSPDAPLVGLEHEFRVTRGREQVPFDSLIESLGLGRRYLDPTDANARRLPSGVAIKDVYVLLWPAMPECGTVASTAAGG